MPRRRSALALDRSGGVPPDRETTKWVIGGLRAKCGGVGNCGVVVRMGHARWLCVELVSGVVQRRRVAGVLYGWRVFVRWWYWWGC